MSVLVTDQGFAPDDFRGEVVDLRPDARPEALSRSLAGTALVRIAFPGFADGRGFSLARDLRRAGYTGRLRASGDLLPDQYAMARRAGFDEVEITDDHAARHTEDHWLFRADWTAHDYQSRLRG